ncbi:MAG: Hsp20/alpha crystallin family protein [Candidatus Kapabacteria bacterium]|nr:Hsp20/alpha crystallin family protein [Candidatus Kapabacteria bacterium]
MKLVRFNPFAEFDSITRSMFRDFDKATAQMQRDQFGGVLLTPRADVAEDATSYHINIELAGIPKEEIKVNISDDRVLTISGEKKAESKSEDKNYYRVERRYGKFSRSFTLPENANTDAITAAVDHGVLNLTIAKMEPAKPVVKEISIA